MNFRPHCRQCPWFIWYIISIHICSWIVASLISNTFYGALSHVDPYIGHYLDGLISMSLKIRIAYHFIQNLKTNPTNLKLLSNSDSVHYITNETHDHIQKHAIGMIIWVGWRLLEYLEFGWYISICFCKFWGPKTQLWKPMGTRDGIYSSKSSSVAMMI